MNQTWWKSSKDVDPDQLRIYSLPPAGKHLVMGPPGSGKTNIMLLRAIYLARGGKPNLKILTFSRSLVEFIRSGVRANGLIQEDRIQTVASWQIRLFADLTGKSFQFTEPDDHDQCRLERGAQLKQAIEHRQLPHNYYDALLIDEAQDLLAEEVNAFARLSENLFFVADSRQRIYQANEGIDAVRALGVIEHDLKYHYRIGRKICVAADRALPSTGPSLSEFCQYDELSLPSSVGIRACDSRSDQMRAIFQRLETQLRAYPGEWIGIVTPKNSLLEELEDFARGTKYEALLTVHRKGDRSFDPDRPIVAMTAHSAKGAEFRAVHIYAAEEFGHRYRREIGFTMITRAKTAVDCYYTNNVEGSLLAAFAEERVPDPGEVFP